MCSRLTLESGLVSRGSKGLCSPLKSDGYVLESTEWLKGSQTSSGAQNR